MSRDGYNLIEIVVVVAVVGVLAVVGIPALERASRAIRLELAAAELASTLRMTRIYAIR